MRLQMLLSLVFLAAGLAVSSLSHADTPEFRRLHLEAQQLSEKGKFEEAAAKFELALRAFKGAPNEEFITMRLNLATAYIQIGRPQEAERLLAEDVTN